MYQDQIKAMQFARDYLAKVQQAAQVDMGGIVAVSHEEWKCQDCKKSQKPGVCVSMDGTTDWDAPDSSSLTCVGCYGKETLKASVHNEWWKCLNCTKTQELKWEDICLHCGSTNLMIENDGKKVEFKGLPRHEVSAPAVPDLESVVDDKSLQSYMDKILKIENEKVKRRLEHLKSLSKKP